MVVNIKGYKVLIDKDDYDIVRDHKWCASRHPNGRIYFEARTKSKYLSLHRMINKTPQGMDCDHRDANWLDLRKSNLRACTRKQNSANARLSSRNTSGYKGVSLHRASGLWKAQICENHRPVFVKYFKTPAEAAKCYKQMMKKKYGQFARCS